MPLYNPSGTDPADRIKIDNMYYDVTSNSIANLIGDDLTDNTTAWNTLFAALPVGATLFFPPGTFRTSTGFNISADKHLRIRGSGKYTTYIKITGATGNGFHINGSYWFNTFEDMGFIHLLTGASVTGGAGININPGAAGSSIGANIYRCSFSGLFIGIRAVGSQAANLSIWDSIDITASQTGFANAVPNGRGILWNGDTINMVLSNSTINMIYPAPAFSQVPASGSACMEINQSGAIQLIGGEFIGGTNTLLMNGNAGGTTSIAAVYATNSFFDQSNGSTVKITGANIVNRCKFVQCGITTGNTAATGAIAFEIASTGTGAAGTATAAADGIDIFDCDIYPNGVTGTTNGIQITGAQGVKINGNRISGFTNGIAITPAASNGYTKITIEGNKMGATNNFTTPNTVGVLLNAGSFQYGPVTISDNDFTGSTTPVTDNSTVIPAAQKKIADNLGMLLTGLAASSIASTAVTAENYLIKMPIGANCFQIGDVIRVNVVGAASAAATITCRMKFGTAGTTADANLIAHAPVMAAAVPGITFTQYLTIRALGAAGVQGVVATNVVHSAAGTATNATLLAATPALNTTTANFLGVSVQASAGTFTLHSATLEVI